MKKKPKKTPVQRLEKHRVSRPDAETVRAELHYCPEDGLLRWAVRRNGATIGAVAGCAYGNGRWSVKLRGYRCSASHLIWCWMTGEWPPKGMMIDHRDCDHTNDRWENLRLATRGQNMANIRRYRKNTSGYKGVTWHKADRRWQAQIMVRGKYRYLGSFACPQKAHDAYCEAAKFHHGEFARFK